MSISAHGCSRLTACAVYEGLGSRRQAGDPHLGRRERVHPGNHADAVRSGIGLHADVGNGRRRSHDRFKRRLDRTVWSGKAPGRSALESSSPVSRSRDRRGVGFPVTNHSSSFFKSVFISMLRCTHSIRSCVRGYSVLTQHCPRFQDGVCPFSAFVWLIGLLAARWESCGFWLIGVMLDQSASR